MDMSALDIMQAGHLVAAPTSVEGAQSNSPVTSRSGTPSSMQRSTWGEATGAAVSFLAGKTARGFRNGVAATAFYAADVLPGRWTAAASALTSNQETAHQLLFLSLSIAASREFCNQIESLDSSDPKILITRRESERAVRVNREASEISRAESPDAMIDMVECNGGLIPLERAKVYVRDAHIRFMQGLEQADSIEFSRTVEAGSNSEWSFNLGRRADNLLINFEGRHIPFSLAQEYIDDITNAPVLVSIPAPSGQEEVDNGEGRDLVDPTIGAGVVTAPPSLINATDAAVTTGVVTAVPVATSMPSVSAPSTGVVTAPAPAPPTSQLAAASPVSALAPSTVIVTAAPAPAPAPAPSTSQPVAASLASAPSTVIVTAAPAPAPAREEAATALARASAAPAVRAAAPVEETAAAVAPTDAPIIDTTNNPANPSVVRTRVQDIATHLYDVRVSAGFLRTAAKVCVWIASICTLGLLPALLFGGAALIDCCFPRGHVVEAVQLPAQNATGGDLAAAGSA